MRTLLVSTPLKYQFRVLFVKHIDPFLFMLLAYPHATHRFHIVLSAFRPRGVPGSTSKLSPRVPAQMGRRETEHEGGKKQAKRGNPRPSCCHAPRSGVLAVGGYKRPRGRALCAGPLSRAANLLV
jgi:hypothetical protein